MKRRSSVVENLMHITATSKAQKQRVMIWGTPLMRVQEGHPGGAPHRRGSVSNLFLRGIQRNKAWEEHCVREEHNLKRGVLLSAK